MVDGRSSHCDCQWTSPCRQQSEHARRDCAKDPVCTTYHRSRKTNTNLEIIQWQRGRSKKIWIEQICRSDNAPKGLKERVKMCAGDWAVVAILAYSLVFIPSILAFLTAFYTPLVGLSCRSMTLLVYMLCQIYLIGLWVWDIHSTFLDDDGEPHTPVTRVPWTSECFLQDIVAAIVKRLPSGVLTS